MGDVSIVYLVYVRCCVCCPVIVYYASYFLISADGNKLSAVPNSKLIIIPIKQRNIIYIFMLLAGVVRYL